MVDGLPGPCGCDLICSIPGSAYCDLEAILGYYLSACACQAQKARKKAKTIMLHTGLHAVCLTPKASITFPCVFSSESMCTGMSAGGSFRRWLWVELDRKEWVSLFLCSSVYLPDLSRVEYVDPWLSEAAVFLPAR